jgi:hypothetical protein
MSEPEAEPPSERTEVVLFGWGLLFCLRRRVVRQSVAAVAAGAVEVESEVEPEGEPEVEAPEVEPEVEPAFTDAPSAPDPFVVLAEELHVLSRNPLPACAARVDRARAAGVFAVQKREGRINRVPATPSLASIGTRLAQPTPKYYVVFRTNRAILVAQVCKDWDVCRLEACREPEFNVPHHTAVFHAWHFRAEVEAYFRGAGLLDVLPADFA